MSCSYTARRLGTPFQIDFYYMKQVQFSVRLFSFYMMGMGLALVFIPNFTIGLLGFAPSTDVWIRMLGLLALVAGGYYYYSAGFELLPFFRATVVGRVVFTLGEVAFVLLGLAPAALLLFAVVEGAGALYTFYALRAYAHNS